MRIDVDRLGEKLFAGAALLLLVTFVLSVTVIPFIAQFTQPLICDRYEVSEQPTARMRTGVPRFETDRVSHCVEYHVRPIDEAGDENT